MPLDNQDELFYWVDESDHIKGRITRKEAHSGTMKMHRAVVVAVFDADKSSIVLQKRSKNKDTSPLHWAMSVGGHVTVGETYRQAVKKETQEELGMAVKARFSHKTIWEGSDEIEMVGVYTGTLSELPDLFDRVEIDELIWVQKNEIESFVKTEKVTELCQQVLGELGWLPSE